MDGGHPRERMASPGGLPCDATRAGRRREALRRRDRLVEDECVERGWLLREGLPQHPGPRAGRNDRPGGCTRRPRPPADAARRDPDEHGEPIGTRIFIPEEIYPQVNGVAPDLIVHFGNLLWRSVGTIGGDEGIHVFENDTGPDDANHAQQGLFVMVAPGVEPGRRDDALLLDIAPTALTLLGLPVPEPMRGKSLV